MTEQEYTENWHLSKAIPVSIILFLAMQTIGIVIWATRIDLRVASLEQSQVSQDVRADKVELVMNKIVIVEERQNAISKRLDIQTEKMDKMMELVKQLVERHP